MPVSAALVLIEGDEVANEEYFLIDPDRPIPLTPARSMASPPSEPKGWAFPLPLR